MKRDQLFDAFVIAENNILPYICNSIWKFKCLVMCQRSVFSLTRKVYHSSPSFFILSFTAVSTEEYSGLGCTHREWFRRGIAPCETFTAGVGFYGQVRD